MGQGPIVQMSWGARLLYIGPPTPHPAHRNSVGELCVGLDAPVHLRLPEASDETLTSRAILVPPGLKHEFVFEGRQIACLFVEEQTGDRDALYRAMDEGPFGVRLGHARLEDVVATLGALAVAGADLRQGKALVEQVLGLRSLRATDPRIAEAIDQIRRDPGGDHSIACLAREAGLSESRFRHAFRKSTGVAFKRYRLWLRLGNAMRLAQRGLNLTEAAHHSGFSSSAHLSSAYRHIFGMTPSQFIALASAARPKPERA